MRAGSLDRRVTIQRQVETRDAYGGVLMTWADVSTVWANVQHMSGKEFLAAQTTEAETLVRVIIRWLSGITTAKLRVVLYETDQGGSPTAQTPMDVVAILPSGDRKRWLQLMCRAGTNNG